MMEQMRLNKYLAHCGVCSRRDADRLIEKGEVLVNGRQAQAGMTVDDGDEILVSGRPVRGVQEPVVLAFYKPFGVVCTEKDVHAESIVSDLVDYPVRVTYAGRLDKDSEGLLLLSNDGDLIQAMMKGANCHEKEYVVRVNREITPDFLEKMSGGVYLEELDITTRKCQVEQMGRFVFRMVLTQGVNRQIKRMCIACGCRVRELKRVRVMHVTLGGLKPGEYRELDREDMERLYRDCGLAAPAGADGLS
ncbi:pseudouridine synthase [uncultured Acetatifactor sp.]|uniref:pseudouridine synthase n=1 Tax=uncultured Acetatifactor sp. TaxID=1671927 RepID=UPI002ED15FBD